MGGRRPKGNFAKLLSIMSCWGLRQAAAACLLRGQAVEVRNHQLRRLQVRDLPERGDDALGSRKLKRLPQPGDTLAVLDFAEAGFAGAQDDELGTAEVAAEDVEAW